METAKGLAGDVYLTLDAYLEAVVPQIARVRWAPRVELAAGVNAMDLTGLSTEMQHLVIKSTIDWVLEREDDTVVVVPEAWKFIPQGRGTPVKLAAEAFIRQGAALKNYLWLDSQDLGGIEKEILRSVPLWILGVQREANEIKRTLDNIPAGIAKPKAPTSRRSSSGSSSRAGGSTRSRPTCSRRGCESKDPAARRVQSEGSDRAIAPGRVLLGCARVWRRAVGPQTDRAGREHGQHRPRVG
jgi:hypothetical protein